MNKSLTLTVFCLLCALPSFASADQVTDINALLNAHPGKSAFDLIKNLFNQAKPMKIEQFPTTYDQLECVAATDTSGNESVKRETFPVVPPVRVKGIIGIGAIQQAAASSAGPLFPATPAIPAKETPVEYIYPTYSIWNQDPVGYDMTPLTAPTDPHQIGDDYVKYKIKAHLTSDVTEEVNEEENNHWHYTYRSLDGYLVWHAEIGGDNYYQYCWSSKQ